MLDLKTRRFFHYLDGRSIPTPRFSVILKGIQTLTLLFSTTVLHADTWPTSGTTMESAPIPFSEIGAKVTADYIGDAIGISSSAGGVQLRTDFQKLVGTVTKQGLALASTEAEGGSLQLWACAVGRVGEAELMTLPATGTVVVEEKSVTWVRPELVEEYSVSVDGVRQDFILSQAPAGSGELRVELALSGATAEAAADGVKLTLDGSRRELAYNRLHVTDATGRTLAATWEVLSSALLAVRVLDAGAIYPVRIDPTFSDTDWVNTLNSGIPGANYAVRATIVDGNGDLYIGGEFTFVGSVEANRIAKWNGSTWSSLGSGMSGTVYALAVIGTDVYAAGDFSMAGDISVSRIAKWNGSMWSRVGSGFSATVNALAVSGTDLYAGGEFAATAYSTFNRIAKWDGSTWSALGSGLTGTVNALAVSGTDLYVGGSFFSAGGAIVNRIAKWNGSTWSALGSGMNEPAYTLAVSGTDLYAGGNFTTAGGINANRIAKWDGNAWSALGSGMNTRVDSLAVNGSDLYAGGGFTTAGGVNVSRIAKWDGSAWSALSSTINASVRALVVTGTGLYAGGFFTTADSVAVNHIAKWDGSAWSALGSGMSKPVHALAVSGTDLYIGGSFTTAGGVGINGIAKWDGSTWSALGLGLNGFVHALAVNGTDLYVGGNFTMVGRIYANYVAKWDGSAWSALGSGMSNSVFALAVSGTDVYAAGDFSMAGGVSARKIAKWNGSTWTPLGSGMNSAVLALAVIGTDLYAGGWFTTAGGADITGIAKWDGSTWSALGSGLTGNVYALAVSGTDIYVGGGFATAGGINAKCIGKWDGSTWSALGSGLNSSPMALAVSGTDLYAGGWFTTAGGINASRIAKWDGSAWSPLGSGVNDTVNSLVIDGNRQLILGGDFTMAGSSTVAPYIVQANVTVADVPSITSATTQANEQTTNGLVIAVDPVDDNEVTHFKITNLTGGILFQNDGITAIPEGSFITVAEGGEGLKFTPALNFIGIAGFDVQAALGLTGNGLIGNGLSAIASAVITVNHPVPEITINGLPVFNPRTGLFELTVRVSNTSTVPMAGFRLTVVNLPPELELRNRTHSILPVIEDSHPLQPSSHRDVVVYYSRNRQQLNWTPEFSIENLSSIPPSLPSDISGTYHGWIARDSDVRLSPHPLVGSRFVLTVSNRGAVTGNILEGRTRRTFRSRLTVGPGDLVSPLLLVAIPRSSATLQLIIDSFTNTLSGELRVAGSATPGALATGWRNTWRNKAPANPPSNFLARHHFALENDDPMLGPQGFGFGVVRPIGRAGRCSVSGRLADGRAMTGSTFFGPDGQVLVYKSLYGHKGSALGTVTIMLTGVAPPLGNTVRGEMTWMKPSTLAAPGFSPLNLIIDGGVYIQPLPGQRVMSLPATSPGTANATLDFTLGALEATLNEFSHGVTVANPRATGRTNRARQVLPNPNRVTITSFNATTGLSGGRLNIPGLPRGRGSFRLLLVPTSAYGQLGFGYYLLPSGNGRVELLPAP